MKKTLRMLLSAVMLVTLLAGMQITAFAAVVSSHPDEVSVPANETASLPNTDRARTDVSGLDETSRLNDVNQMPTVEDIHPISANPDTGAENLAIPAIVALLAASTAAIVLSSKKRS